MSSLLTNSSAMVALQTLKGINNQMETTQSRISTGMRVNDASDNAAYWSIATTMRSDNMGLSAVEDALGLGAATVDVAFTAMDKSIDVVKQIKAKLIAAKDPTIDRGKVQSDITALQKQLRTYSESANFNGENWLAQDADTDNLNKEVVGTFTRDSSGQVSVETIVVDTSATLLIDANSDATTENAGILSKDLMQLGTAAITITTPGSSTTASPPVHTPTVYSVGVAAAGDLDGLLKATFQKEVDAQFAALSDADKATFGLTEGNAILTAVTDKLTSVGNSVLDFDISGLGNAQLDLDLLSTVISKVDGQLSEMTDAATSLGSAKSRISMQKEFVSNLSDAIDRGIGQLVDADMNEESTRLKALQTQQQLGIQALSIANNASQNILSLFR